MKYDYVVVGAGLAGLAAACETAKAGHKTLLIEKHNIPGGCATSFRRGRFEFEPSLHELCGVGSVENPGSTRQILDSYGVDINWKFVPDCFRVVSKFSDGGDMDCTMPAGKEAFIDAMEYYVPGSRKSMEDMFEVFDEIDVGLTAASDDSYPKQDLLTNFPNMLKVGSYSSKAVFDALKIPQRAQDILAVYWSYLGVDIEHLSFLHYASMVNSYVQLGAYIPAHTSHEISTALVERFREMGGDVLFNCRAEEFIFDGKKCVGVKTNMGTFEADTVFANINPDIIYGTMMPANCVPEREKKLSKARKRNFGGRMFTIYMGLNKTAEELGIKDYSIFLCSTADSAKEYETLKHIDTDNYSIFLCYNIANSEASPKGTSMCSFTTMFSASEDWNCVTDETYVAIKEKLAKRFIDTLKEKTGIDLLPYIEEISIATPMTFARYLGVPEGSVYGYETRDWDDIITRTMSMATDYPIDGLVPIGTSGIRGDGYSSALACGQIISQFIMNKNGGQ